MLKFKAHAKLNLFLEIVGKRADGYHFLQSQFVFLDLHDELCFEKAAKTSLIGSNFADDIILVAAKEFLRKFDVGFGTKIHLHKNIPIAAGLGGGSADAATTIFALNQLHKIGASAANLLALAAEIGADVPACLHSILHNQNSLFVEGIGEKISAAPAPKNLHFLLANPQKPLHTKNVFAGIKQILPPTDSVNFVDRRNDLQNAAIAILPEIAEILVALQAQPNCQLARMTGSGATCFGLFETEAAAKLAEQQLKSNFPNLWLCATSLK